MASRYRSLSKPALAFLKSSAKTPSTRLPSSPLLSRPPQFQRVSRGVMIGMLESMLPLHSAVSSARLTSRLGIDSGVRSLSQGTICSSNPGI